MTSKKIQQLADFFYSSDDANDVPVRISIMTGQFSGFDLSQTAFIELLKILNNSISLKKYLEEFREKY